MRKSLLTPLLAAVALAAATLAPSARLATAAATPAPVSSAAGATVRVLEPGGRVRLVAEPSLGGLPAALLAPAPARSSALESSRASTSPRSAVTSARGRGAASITVVSTLAALLHRGQITSAQYNGYLDQWNAALAEERGLPSARRAQLADVTVLLHNLAVRGAITAARLPVLFLTLERNAQWWQHGSMLAYPDRVMFAGSQLLWQYYPGAGLQLQILGNFGEADGFYESGRQNWPKLVQLLGELRTLAVARAGGTTWEYDFDWEGGAAPWVSAMAQATGLIAFTNGYLATGDRSYLTTAHRMLPLLEHAPPTGVAVGTQLGERFLQYSFAPHTDIINAFLQTLIGLYDYHAVSRDPVAEQLFTAGNAQAQAELPAFVIGGWSLYQPGVIDDLNYHELVTSFLQSLCDKTQARSYCGVYADFSGDLVSRPRIVQVTTTATAGRRLSLRFHVSKLSQVGAIVSRGGHDYLYTDQLTYAGTHSFTIPALKRGTYTVSLSAKDMVGHFTEANGRLICAPARH